MAASMYKMDSFAQEVTPRCDVMYSVEPYAVIAAAAAGPTDRLGKLAARQQAILDSLAALSAQIDSLGPAPQGGSPKPAAGSTAAGSGGVKLDKHGHPLPDASHARPLPATTDVSLLCSPSNPPYATLLAASVIAERVGEVQIRQFWHSTLPLPAGFRSENPFNGDHCKTRITVIWNSEPDTRMVVSAASQVPIVGDINTARYLCRVHNVDLYPADLMSAAQVDEWVDSSGTMIAGSAKDLKLALKAANQSLSKSTYLVDDKLSLADIGIWGAIKSKGVSGSIPSNVKTWLKNMDGLSSSATVLETLGETIGGV